MTFRSLDLEGKVLDRDLKKHLPEAQHRYLAEYEEKIAGVLIPNDELLRVIDDAAKIIVEEYLTPPEVNTVVGVYVLVGARESFGVLKNSLFKYGLRIIEGNIKASRYDEKVVSTEAPIISYDVRSVCSGDNVLIAEDIFDEGITLQNINARIKLFNPASIKIFSLLFKPQKYQGDIRIHYPLFKIDDHWIVGYGMDLNEKDDKGRNRALLRDLPFIAVTNPDYLLKIGKIGQERADHLKGLIK